MKSIVIYVLIVYNSHTSNIGGYYPTSKLCWDEAQVIRKDKRHRQEGPPWKADCIMLKVELENYLSAAR